MIGWLPGPPTFVIQAKNYCILSQILWFLIFFYKHSQFHRPLGMLIIESKLCSKFGQKNAASGVKLHDDKMIEWTY